MESAQLFLTSGMDYCVKLWDPNLSNKPLASFEWGDVLDTTDALDQPYISAVEWCPSHPTLFAASTGDGGVYVWDLGHSIDSYR